MAAVRSAVAAAVSGRRLPDVAISVDVAALEVADPVRDAAAALGKDPLEWVLTGGEDHALAATFPTRKAVPKGWTVASDLDHLAGKPTPLANLINSVAIGGAKLRLVRRDLRGAPLRVALLGDWQFTADQLADTVDYTEVVDRIRAVSDSRRFNLIEALAATVADDLLDSFPVSVVRVRVRKPEVRLDATVEYTAATVERGPR